MNRKTKTKTNKPSPQKTWIVLLPLWCCKRAKLIIQLTPFILSFFNKIPPHMSVVLSCSIFLFASLKGWFGLEWKSFYFHSIQSKWEEQQWTHSWQTASFWLFLQLLSSTLRPSHCLGIAQAQLWMVSFLSFFLWNKYNIILIVFCFCFVFVFVLLCFKRIYLKKQVLKLILFMRVFIISFLFFNTKF